jgi:hypothetical protein
MKRRRFTTLTVLLLALAGGEAIAQRVAVKEDILYGAGTLTPNLALEVAAGKHSTFGLMAGYNPWNHKGSEGENRKIAHFLVVPEYRYWTCEPFNGHFFGAHLLFGRFNIGGVEIPPLLEREYRHEGSAVGAGLAYGYHLAINAAWGVEFTLGAGVVYLDYEKFPCTRCGELLAKNSKYYVGPTRAGISLVYILK